MDFYKLFYLFTMGDKLATFWGWLAFITTVIFLILGLILILAEDGKFDSGKKTDDEEVKKGEYYWYLNLRTLWRWSLVLCPLSWLLWIATPTKKEAVMIVAGGAIGNFLTTDSSAKALPADITNFLRVQIQ